MREHLRRVAAGANHPGPDLPFVGAQHQDRIVELARELERIPCRALRLRRAGIDRRRRVRCAHGDVGEPCRTVDLDCHRLVAIRVLLDRACWRSQGDALRV